MHSFLSASNNTHFHQTRFFNLIADIVDLNVLLQYGVKIFVITSFKDTCYIEILPNVQKSNRGMTMLRAFGLSQRQNRKLVPPSAWIRDYVNELAHKYSKAQL